MAAAVSDYRPAERAPSKLKKAPGDTTLVLTRTPDILAALGKAKGARFLIGFAAETDRVLENARAKRTAKNADLLVANDVSRPDSGFASDDNAAVLIDSEAETELPLMSKRALADRNLGPGAGAPLAAIGAGPGQTRRAPRPPEVTKVPDDVLLDLRERARYFAELSDVGVPRSALAAPVPVVAAPVVKAPALAAPAPRTPRPPASPVFSTEGAELPDLEAVRGWVGDCQRCKLAGGRKTIVFGQGNAQAQLMFVGEAPGADEDEQGLAFVGRAGQLLTDIIEKGLKIPRADVFIANVLKCRPPQNRNPEPDEILSCQPFLEKQIALIRPKVLVGLGKFSAQWLFKSMEPISRLRGRIGDFDGIKVVPTFHPAYLLRNPSAKKDVWEDMKVVRRLLAEDEA
jgi:DNA polymerase